MAVCEKRGFELIKKMGFVRVSGTAEEKKAAQILCDEAASFGVKCDVETFEVEDAVMHRAELEVMEPYQKKYEVTGYLRSRSTPEDGLECDLVYVEDAMDANLVNVEGKIVLLNSRPRRDVYEKLCKAGVKGYITFSGSMLDDPEKSDLDVGKLRPALTEGLPVLSAVNVRPWDALEMVMKEASRVRMVIENENVTLESQNVCAEIVGTEYPDEVILFSAHYDSVLFSTGVYDNAAGSATIMELMRHFAENPPKRTVRFVWFGSEEQGLLGSKDYVKKHDVKNIKLVINCDVGAPAMGVNRCSVMATEAAANYVDAMFKEAGYPMGVRSTIYSSDSIPFADLDVPGLNFIRGAARGVGFIHDRNDVIDYLSPKGLGAMLHPVLMLSDRIVNAAVLPIARKVSKEIHDEVDKYLFKKK
ncbi:MAG: M20/M25/M40 family metallo-hydrolase [Clostridia bacterium]|nr:M20/M25/M40 family metallo-hydrolase [Clostridia bacterium]